MDLSHILSYRSHISCISMSQKQPYFRIILDFSTGLWLVLNLAQPTQIPVILFYTLCLGLFLKSSKVYICCIPYSIFSVGVFGLSICFCHCIPEIRTANIRRMLPRCWQSRKHLPTKTYTAVVLFLCSVWICHFSWVIYCGYTR